MIKLDRIYNMDCMEGMKQIPDGTIDALGGLPGTSASARRWAGATSSSPSRCEVPIEALDRQAGVEKLNFGFFSIIDTYSQRQHISDPDEVLNVQWVKVWQSLLKDAEFYKFQRRKDKLIEMQFKK